MKQQPARFPQPFEPGAGRSPLPTRDEERIQVETSDLLALELSTPVTTSAQIGTPHPSTPDEELPSVSRSGGRESNSFASTSGSISAGARLDAHALGATQDTVEPTSPDSAHDLRPKTSEGQPLLFNRVDRYTLLSELGRGGMGVVYRAWDPQLDRTVALKMLLWSGMAGEVRRRRFKREAQAIARLEHPGIVRVYDSGVHEGSPFYTMDYLAGQTLAERLEQEKRFSPEAALRVVALVARALGHAHARGIVHWDVKPGNILLTENNEPHILRLRNRSV